MVVLFCFYIGELPKKEWEKKYVRNNVSPVVPWAHGKTRRIMASNLKLVDIVVELCDARIPQSSRNPEIDKIVGKKPRLMLLNKADCADAAATEQWLTYYRKKGSRPWPVIAAAAAG